MRNITNFGSICTCVTSLVAILGISCACPADTMWMDVVNTQTVEEVVREAGFATRQEVADVYLSITNIASSVASNTVDDCLSATPLNVTYDSSGESICTNAFLLPSWAVSPVVFTDVSPDQSGEDASSITHLFPSGKYRNSSIMVDKLPELADGKQSFATVSFDALADTHRIFASPAWDDPADPKYAEAGVATAVAAQAEVFSNAWFLVEADIPCTITVRETKDGMLLVSKQKYMAEGN